MRRIKQFILLTNKDEIEQPVNTYGQYSDISFVICGINMGYKIKISYNNIASIKKLDVIRYNKRYRIRTHIPNNIMTYIHYKHITYHLTIDEIIQLYTLIMITPYDIYRG